MCVDALKESLLPRAGAAPYPLSWFVLVHRMVEPGHIGRNVGVVQLIQWESSGEWVLVDSGLRVPMREPNFAVVNACGPAVRQWRVFHDDGGGHVSLGGG